MNTEIVHLVHSKLVEAAHKAENDPSAYVKYRDIMDWAGISSETDYVSDALGTLFYEINEYDRSQDINRPMLSTMAVAASGFPGKGLYALAKQYGKYDGRSENDELTFWMHEQRAVRKYWQSRSKTTFGELTVTYQNVWETLREFDKTYPDSNDYDQWLDKVGYKYALEFCGRLYPPKHVLSEVTGISTTEFSGGDQTNRVFQQLGLVIIDKPGHTAASEVATRDTYLLTWNPARFAWDDFQGDWDAFYMGSRPHLRWSCGNTKSIVQGDRIFLMRLGYQQDIKGLVASGIVTAAPFEAPHWNEDSSTNTALYIEFEPDVLLNPETDDLLDPKIVTQDFDWFPQRSGITIPQEVARHLGQVWQQHIQRLNVVDSSPTTATGDTNTYREGSRTLVTSYRYERDPRAREDCINHYGTRCAVCEFDFGENFGVIGEGFIHVHHEIPISERGEEYIVNPIEDLKPVCPNCHAMLHRKSPTYTIEELKYILNQSSK